MSTTLSPTLIAGAGIAMLLLAGCSAPPGPDAAGVAPSASPASHGDGGSVTQSVVDYIDAGLPDLADAKIAYLSECVTENNFCQTRLEAVEQASADMNFELTTFNGGFSVETQLQQVQDAIQRGFDGYIFAPVADAAGCSYFEMLRATGKPIVTVDSPMCGDVDYTEGTVGYVSMTSPDFYQRGAEAAFASCDGSCEAVVLGGYVGTDLFTRWQRSIAAAAANHPDVDVVVDQPADFDAARGMSLMQDALSSDPDIEVVFTQSDDISRGVEQAVIAAGKIPGKDVRIYGTGGTREAVTKVKDGSYTATNALLPYEEGYYGAVILAKAIATGEATPGFTDLAYAPVILNGPGTPILTIDNIGDFEGEW